MLVGLIPRPVSHQCSLYVTDSQKQVPTPASIEATPENRGLGNLLVPYIPVSAPESGAECVRPNDAQSQNPLPHHVAWDGWVTLDDPSQASFLQGHYDFVPYDDKESPVFNPRIEDPALIDLVNSITVLDDPPEIPDREPWADLDPWEHTWFQDMWVDANVSEFRSGLVVREGQTSRKMTRWHKCSPHHPDFLDTHYWRVYRSGLTFVSRQFSVFLDPLLYVFGYSNHTPNFPLYGVISYFPCHCKGSDSWVFLPATRYMTSNMPTVQCTDPTSKLGDFHTLVIALSIVYPFPNVFNVENRNFWERYIAILSLIAACDRSLVAFVAWYTPVIQSYFRCVLPELLVEYPGFMRAVQASTFGIRQLSADVYFMSSRTAALMHRSATRNMKGTRIRCEVKPMVEHIVSSLTIVCAFIPSATAYVKPTTEAGVHPFWFIGVILFIISFVNADFYKYLADYFEQRETKRRKVRFRGTMKRTKSSDDLDLEDPIPDISSGLKGHSDQVPSDDTAKVDASKLSEIITEKAKEGSGEEYDYDSDIIVDAVSMFIATTGMTSETASWKGFDAVRYLFMFLMGPTSHDTYTRRLSYNSLLLSLIWRDIPENFFKDIYKMVDPSKRVGMHGHAGDEKKKDVDYLSKIQDYYLQTTSILDGDVVKACSTFMTAICMLPLFCSGAKDKWEKEKSVLSIFAYTRKTLEDNNLSLRCVCDSLMTFIGVAAAYSATGNLWMGLSQVDDWLDERYFRCRQYDRWVQNGDLNANGVSHNEVKAEYLLLRKQLLRNHSVQPERKKRVDIRRAEVDQWMDRLMCSIKEGGTKMQPFLVCLIGGANTGKTVSVPKWTQMVHLWANMLPLKSVAKVLPNERYRSTIKNDTTTLVIDDLPTLNVNFRTAYASDTIVELFNTHYAPTIQADLNSKGVIYNGAIFGFITSNRDFLGTEGETTTPMAPLRRPTVVIRHIRNDTPHSTTPKGSVTTAGCDYMPCGYREEEDGTVSLVELTETPLNYVEIVEFVHEVFKTWHKTQLDLIKDEEENMIVELCGCKRANPKGLCPNCDHERDDLLESRVTRKFMDEQSVSVHSTLDPNSMGRPIEEEDEEGDVEDEDLTEDSKKSKGSFRIPVRKKTKKAMKGHALFSGKWEEDTSPVGGLSIPGPGPVPDATATAASADSKGLKDFFVGRWPMFAALMGSIPDTKAEGWSWAGCFRSMFLNQFVGAVEKTSYGFYIMMQYERIAREHPWIVYMDELMDTPNYCRCAFVTGLATLLFCQTVFIHCMLAICWLFMWPMGYISGKYFTSAIYATQMVVKADNCVLDPTVDSALFVESQRTQIYDQINWFAVLLGCLFSVFSFFEVSRAVFYSSAMADKRLGISNYMKKKSNIVDPVAVAVFTAVSGAGMLALFRSNLTTRVINYIAQDGRQGAESSKASKELSSLPDGPHLEQNLEVPDMDTKKKAIQEANERPHSWDAFRHVPHVPTKSSVGMTGDQLIEKLQRALVRMECDVEGKVINTTGLLLANNMLLLPKHMFHGKEENTMLSKINTRIYNSVRTSKQVVIELESTYIPEGHDWVVTLVSGLASAPRLLDHFAEKSPSGTCVAHMMKINKDGKVSDPLVLSLQDDEIRYKVAHERRVLQKGWSYVSAEKFVIGDCASPIFVKDKSACLVGIHIAGDDGDGFGLKITSGQIADALEFFSDKPYFMESKSFEGIRTKFGLKERAVNPQPHPRNTVNYFPDGVTPEVLGDIGKKVSFRFHTQTNPLAPKFEREFGIEQPFGKPRTTPSRMYRPLLSIASQSPHIPPNLLQFAYEDYVFGMEDLEVPEFIPKGRAYTPDEILNSQPNHPYRNGVKTKTSAGDGYDCCKEKLLQGEPGNWELKPEVQKTVDEVTATIMDRKYSGCLYKSFAKDEPLPLAKLDWPRSVFGVNFVIQLLAQMYLSPAADFIQYHGEFFETAIGQNVVSEEYVKLMWQLWQQDKVKLGFAIDMSKFDMSLDRKLRTCTSNVFLRILDKVLDYPKPLLEVSRWLLDEILVPFVEVNGSIVYLSALMASGQPFTSFMDGMCGSMLVRSSAKNHIDLETGEFRKKMLLRNLGDDNVGKAVDGFPTDLWGMKVFEDDLQEWGMHATPPTKDGEFEDWTTPQGMEFLKRVPYYHPDLKMPVQCLDVKSILRPFYCFIQSKEIGYATQMVECARGSMEEFYLFGREGYEFAQRAFEKIFLESGLPYDKVVMRPYDEMTAVWKERVGHFETECPVGLRNLDPPPYNAHAGFEEADDQGQTQKAGMTTVETVSTVKSGTPYTRIPMTEVSPSPAEQVSKLLEREVYLSGFALQTRRIETRDFWPYELWGNNSYINARLKGYAYFRADMHLRIVNTSNAGHYGKAWAVVTPMPHSVEFQGESNVAFQTSLCQYSQRNHVEINFGQDETVEIDIPFIYPMPLMETRGYGSNQLPKLTIVTVTHLQHSLGSEEPVYIKIYGSLRNTKFVGTTFTGHAGEDSAHLQQEEAEHRVSKTLAATSVVTGQMASAFSGSVFALPLEVVSAATGMAGVAASHFGFSRPVKGVSNEFIPVASTTLSRVDVPVNAKRLCLTEGQAVSIDAGIMGSENPDPLSYESLFSKPAFIERVQWRRDHDVGMELLKLPVTPNMRVSHLPDDTTFALTPAAMVSSQYLYWAGSITYEFEVVSHSTSSGELILYYDPYCFLRPGREWMTEEPSVTTHKSLIVDVRERRKFSVTVHWNSRALALFTQGRGYWPGNDDTKQNYRIPIHHKMKPDTGTCNGSLSLRVSNRFSPMTPENESSYATIIVHQRVHPDMVFFDHVPCGLNGCKILNEHHLRDFIIRRSVNSNVGPMVRALEKNEITPQLESKTRHINQTLQDWYNKFPPGDRPGAREALPSLEKVPGTLAEDGIITPLQPQWVKDVPDSQTGAPTLAPTIPPTVEVTTMPNRVEMVQVSSAFVAIADTHADYSQPGNDWVLTAYPTGIGQVPIRTMAHCDPVTRKWEARFRFNKNSTIISGGGSTFEDGWWVVKGTGDGIVTPVVRFEVTGPLTLQSLMVSLPVDHTARSYLLNSMCPRTAVVANAVGEFPVGVLHPGETITLAPPDGQRPGGQWAERMLTIIYEGSLTVNGVPAKTRTEIGSRLSKWPVGEPLVLGAETMDPPAYLYWAAATLEPNLEGHSGEEGMTIGNPIDENKVRRLCSGERLPSVRPLLKIFTPLRSYEFREGTTTHLETIYYPFASMPVNHPLKLFGFAFVAVRGGILAHYHIHGDAVIWTARANSFQDELGSGDFFKGYEYTDSRVNPTLTVEYPYYSNLLFTVLRAEPVLSERSLTKLLRIVALKGDGFVQESISVAEDFSLGHFLGSPLIQAVP